MYEIGEYIINFGISVAALWIVDKFWSTFYEKKRGSFLSVFVCFLYLGFQMVHQGNRGNINIVGLLVNALIILLIAVFRYQSTGRKKFFLLLLLLSVWALFEEFVFFAIRNINIESESRNLIGVIVSLIIMLILAYTFSLIYRKEQKDYIPGKIHFILLLIPIGSIYITIDEFYTQGSTLSSMTVVSILIFINIIIFELYSQLNKIYIQEKEKAVYEQRIDIVTENMQEQKIMMEKFFREKHNLINELIVLKKDAEEDDKEAVIKNINKIMKNCYSIENICSCGNSTIDALINYKHSIAKELGIEFRLNIFVPEEVPINEYDLGVILGNALDNAIEAVKECKTVERVIDISISVRKETLIINIKNPYEHELESGKKGELISTKSDKENHGYGVKSIKEITEQNGGEVMIDCQNNIFSLTIITYF